LSVAEVQETDAADWCGFCSGVGTAILRLILMLLRKGV
jgi:hypothetical protein